MIRKIIMDSGLALDIIFEYRKNNIMKSKNDLPIRILDILDLTYKCCIWCSNQKNLCTPHKRLPLFSRNDDLPSYIDFKYIKFKYMKYDTIYRYNGFTVTNNYINTRYYKFINGICLEKLKEELIND